MSDETISSTGKVPKVGLGAISNVFIRMMHFTDAGDYEHGHKHPYDHISLLCKGSVEVSLETSNNDFRVESFEAPCMIYIEREKNHIIKALQANTIVACVHALRNTESLEILDTDALVRPEPLQRIIPKWGPVLVQADDDAVQSWMDRGGGTNTVFSLPTGFAEPMIDLTKPDENNSLLFPDLEPPPLKFE